MSDFIPRDPEDQADYVLSAMRGVVSLMSSQTPGLGVPADELGELWAILVEEIAKVVPNAGRVQHGIPANRNDD